MKTAASDYSFVSSDGTPQLFQKMFPGDVSVNFTVSRTKVSYMISDKTSVKIFHSRFGDTPFSMMRRGILKAESSVTYTIGHERNTRSVLDSCRHYSLDMQKVMIFIFFYFFIFICNTTIQQCT